MCERTALYRFTRLRNAFELFNPSATPTKLTFWSYINIHSRSRTVYTFKQIFLELFKFSLQIVTLMTIFAKYNYSSKCKRVLLWTTIEYIPKSYGSFITKSILIISVIYFNVISELIKVVIIFLLNITFQTCYKRGLSHFLFIYSY